MITNFFLYYQSSLIQVLEFSLLGSDYLPWLRVGTRSLWTACSQRSIDSSRNIGVPLLEERTMVSGKQKQQNSHCKSGDLKKGKWSIPQCYRTYPWHKQNGWNIVNIDCVTLGPVELLLLKCARTYQPVLRDRE